MILENLKKDNDNVFVKQELIPLGYNTYKGNCDNYNKIITLPYKKNGSIVAIATSGWGKSVLIRRLIEYKGYLSIINRPMLIIDTQGVDHRLMTSPNPHPRMILKDQGEFPFSFVDVELYTPIFASNKAYNEDTVFGITLTDLTPKDFLSSGMSISSKDELFKIKILSEKNRRIMKRPTLFYNEFANIPSKGKATTVSSLDYPEGIINYSIKQSLERYFSVWKGYNPSDDEKPEWMDKKRFIASKIPPYFVDETSKIYKPTFWAEYEKNKNIIVNFMDCKEQEIAMAIYGGYILKDAYEYCSVKKKEDEDFNGLFIFVEECNLFIDASDTYLEKGSNFYLTEILCRGFKFEMDIVASFQSIVGSNKHIREYLTSGSNPVLIGNLTNQDRKYLNDIFPGIGNIKLRNRDELPSGLKYGACEWIVYYNDTDYDTFVPCPSMSRFHKRGK